MHLPFMNALFEKAETFLTFAGKSHVHACLLLTLLGLACYLPGFSSLQPMDRDEPRFAQATKQMVETGDLVDIRFQDEARHKKPVGIYWFQSLSVKTAETLGIQNAKNIIAVYRIPSLLGALGMMLLTYWTALTFFAHKKWAFLAAALVGSSIIVIVEAHLAKTDAMLGFCCIAVMGGLARCWMTRPAPLQLKTKVIFWSALGTGILIKGPVILLFLVTTILVLSWRERSLKWLARLSPHWGVPLILLMVAPWFVAIALKSQGAFYTESVGHDLLGKAGTAQVQHWAPPGTYLLAFFGTFWPAALLASIATPYAWLKRREDDALFLIAWTLPSWLIFEAIPTKLPHYVMPLYPAFAILTIKAAVDHYLTPQRPGAPFVAFLMPVIALGLTLGLCAATLTFENVIPWQALLFLLAAVGVACLSWWAFANNRVMASLIIASVASIFISIGALGLTNPLLQALKLSPRLADIAKTSGCQIHEMGSLGYREPSLIFLTGTHFQLLDDALDAVNFIKPGTCRLVFVEKRFETDFLALLQNRGINGQTLARIHGFNINGGKKLEIAAYKF